MARLLHVICHFRGQWIPGDERGFRSRDHRVHSSGDYRNRPPVDEHAGLRAHVRSKMGDIVTLDAQETRTLGEAFLAKLSRTALEVVAVSCSATHLHVLYRSNAEDAKREIGKAKQFASLKLPVRTGSIWGRGCSIVAVRDASHAATVKAYIIAHHQNERAWVWDASVDSCE